MDSGSTDEADAPVELRLLTTLHSAGSPREQLDLVLRELHSARPLLTKIRSLYETWLREPSSSTESITQPVGGEERDLPQCFQKGSRVEPRQGSLQRRLVVGARPDGAHCLPPVVNWTLVRKLIWQVSDEAELSIVEQAPVLSSIFESLSSALREADRPRDGAYLLSIWKCSLQLLVRAVKEIHVAATTQKEEMAKLKASRPQPEEVAHLQQLVERANRECKKLENEISDLLELLQTTDNELADLKSDEQRLLEQLGILRKKHTTLSADISAVQNMEEARVRAVETPVVDKDPVNVKEIQVPVLQSETGETKVKSVEERKSRDSLRKSRREVIEGLSQLCATYSVLVDQAEAGVPARRVVEENFSLTTQTTPSFLDSIGRAPAKKPRTRLRRRSISRKSLDASVKAVTGSQFSNVVEDFLDTKSLEYTRVAIWSISAVERVISAVYCAVFGCKANIPSLLRIDLTRRSRVLFAQWYDDDTTGDRHYASFLSSLNFYECKSVEANAFLQLCFSLGLQERLVLYNVLYSLVEAGETCSDGKLLFGLHGAVLALKKVFLEEVAEDMIQQLLQLKFDVVHEVADCSPGRKAVVYCGDLLMLVAKEVKRSVLLSSKQEKLLAEVNSVLLQ